MPGDAAAARPRPSPCCTFSTPRSTKASTFSCILRTVQGEGPVRPCALAAALLCLLPGGCCCSTRLRQSGDASKLLGGLNVSKSLPCRARPSTQRGSAWLPACRWAHGLAGSVVGWGVSMRECAEDGWAPCCSHSRPAAFAGRASHKTLRTDAAGRAAPHVCLSSHLFPPLPPTPAVAHLTEAQLWAAAGGGRCAGGRRRDLPRRIRAADRARHW